jgi:hypothetical protein
MRFLVGMAFGINLGALTGLGNRSKGHPDVDFRMRGPVCVANALARPAHPLMFMG